MKDQGKTAPRRRELVGRNAFPPFKRNQIRWALHCYRWKEGISWEKYPYVIASALGIRELGEGLNSRDPRGFVLEGETPKPEKLRLYERFIETVAPAYAKAFTEDGFTSTLADMLGRYMNPDGKSGGSDYLTIEHGENLEDLVYFEPCPGINKFEGATIAWISVFRRIGETPYFTVLSITVDISFLTQPILILDEFGTTKPALREKLCLENVLNMPFDDTLIISEYWNGVAVPFAEGSCFLVLFESISKQKHISEFCPCSVASKYSKVDNWHTEYFYAKASFEAPCMHSFLFRTDTASTFSPTMEESLMIGVKHEAAQNFFSTMNLRISK